MTNIDIEKEIHNGYKRLVKSVENVAQTLSNTLVLIRLPNPTTDI